MTDPATSKPVRNQRESKLSRKAPISRLREAAVWQPIANGWRQIYGGFYESGVSIEWHDFEAINPFDWSRSFHPESLELCLNLAGHASVRCQETALDFAPLTGGFYLPGEPALQAWRPPGERHRFVTVEFSARFLREQLAGCDGALHPLVEQFIQGKPRGAGLGELHWLNTEQDQLIGHLLRPPVFQGARSLWYQSKLLQLMVDFFFERRGDDELFCDRQKRTSRQRAERVAALLRRRLSAPPSLEEIGREVGSSPFYLSRTFSREMGMTIPQFLRKIRMERAAELLHSGKYNVTEAAMEVGYSSLSHFSQAFCQTMGCCPALYPHAKLHRSEPLS